MSTESDNQDPSDEPSAAEEIPEPGMFDTLLMPLRLPGRVVSDIQQLAQAVLSLQSVAEKHLSSVDDRAGELVERVASVHESVDRIERRVESLESLETTIEDMMKGLRADLNERMQAVEHELRGMQPPMEQMARDVAKIDDLLPNPHDGPLTRLKDTFSSND